MLNQVNELVGSNFSSWASGMTMFFRSVGASWVVEKNEAPADQVAMDGVLVAYVWSKVGEEYRYLVNDMTSAVAAWKSLHDYFNKSTMPRRIQARHDFYHVEHDPSQSIDIYIHAVTKARKALTDLGCKVDDVEMLDVLFMNLDSSYDTIRMSILTAKEEPLLETVKGILTGSTRSVMLVKSEPAPVALAAQDARRGGRRDYGSGGGRFGSGGNGGASREDKGYCWCDPSNEGHCHRCGRSGHIAARCVHDMPQHVKDWVLGGPKRSPSPNRNSACFAQDEELANDVVLMGSQHYAHSTQSGSDDVSQVSSLYVI